MFLLYFVQQVGGWLTRCYRSFARARAGEERDLRQRSTFSNKRRGLGIWDGAQIQRQRLCCTFSSQCPIVNILDLGLLLAYSAILYFLFLNMKFRFSGNDLILATSRECVFGKKTYKIETWNTKLHYELVHVVWQNCSARSTIHIAMCLKTNSWISAGAQLASTSVQSM